MQIRASPQVPRWSFRTVGPTGRAAVIVAMADTIDGPPEELDPFALSVPDARRLITMLERALDGPPAGFVRQM
jgi:hypothetical protein